MKSCIISASNDIKRGENMINTIFSIIGIVIAAFYIIYVIRRWNSEPASLTQKWLKMTMAVLLLMILTMKLIQAGTPYVVLPICLFCIASIILLILNNNTQQSSHTEMHVRVKK